MLRTCALTALYLTAVIFAFVSNFWWPALPIAAGLTGAWVAFMVDAGPVPNRQARN
jgi:hypothetical protein